MVEGIMDLDETRVHAVMTPRTQIVTLDDDADWDQAMEAFASSPYRRLPIKRRGGEEIVGILYAKDMLAALLRDERPVPLELARRPLFVPGVAYLDDALNRFRETSNQLAVVVDEYGGTEGLLTMEDILEEIVGEIIDEFDQEMAPFTKLGEGHYLISARTEIKSLNETLHLELPAGDYETLAGFLISELGDLPRAGEQLQYRNLKFTVRQAEARAVKEVELFVDVAPE